MENVAISVFGQIQPVLYFILVLRHVHKKYALNIYP